MRIATLLVGALLCSLPGCGGGAAPPPTPVGVGPGRAYMPPSLWPAAKAGRPIGRFRCDRPGPGFGVYVELFAYGRVVLIPPGVGVAPPRAQSGAYVAAGRCEYPLRTHDSTGVVSAFAHGTLGDFFSIWGQPLSRDRLAGFRAPVRAYVGGRRADVDPRTIALERHSVIVLEVGQFIAPHRSYDFPPGL